MSIGLKMNTIYDKTNGQSMIGHAFLDIWHIESPYNASHQRKDLFNCAKKRGHNANESQHLCCRINLQASRTSVTQVYVIEKK